MKEKNATSKFIKEIMGERGLKISDLAEKIGYSKTMLSYMLNDQRNIKDVDVLRIAQALNVTPNHLFGFESNTEMPMEIVVRTEPKKIADLVDSIQSQQRSRTDTYLAKAVVKIMCKFVEDFGLDDDEINEMLEELKNKFFNK